MAKEIERKFMIADDSWRDGAEIGSKMRQFYLVAHDAKTVRVRLKDGKKAVLTIKIGGARRSRDEFEYEIPVGDVEDLQAFAVGTVVEKTRWIARHDGLTWEIDVFEGALSGLVMAELETEDDIPDDRLPGWVGREVTGIEAYYNAVLALKGLPETTD